jgi:hypothetical protein
MLIVQTKSGPICLVQDFARTPTLSLYARWRKLSVDPPIAAFDLRRLKHRFPLLTIQYILRK